MRRARFGEKQITYTPCLDEAYASRQCGGGFTPSYATSSMVAQRGRDFHSELMGPFRTIRRAVARDVPGNPNDSDNSGCQSGATGNVAIPACRPQCP